MRKYGLRVMRLGFNLVSVWAEQQVGKFLRLHLFFLKEWVEQKAISVFFRKKLLSCWSGFSYGRRVNEVNPARVASAKQTAAQRSLRVASAKQTAAQRSLRQQRARRKSKTLVSASVQTQRAATIPAWRKKYFLTNLIDCFINQCWYRSWDKLRMTPKVKQQTQKQKKQKSIVTVTGEYRNDKHKLQPISADNPKKP